MKINDLKRNLKDLSKEELIKELTDVDVKKLMGYALYDLNSGKVKVWI